MEKREMYAQAYRRALEEGLSTVEALQRAQQAISSPGGGFDPKKHLAKRPSAGLLAHETPHEGAHESQSAPADAVGASAVKKPKVVGATFRGGATVVPVGGPKPPGASATARVAGSAANPAAAGGGGKPAASSASSVSSSSVTAALASSADVCEEAVDLRWHRVYPRLRGWWETPQTLHMYRLWAMAGCCGFPGCPLGEKHFGEHQYDPEMINFAK